MHYSFAIIMGLGGVATLSTYPIRFVQALLGTHFVITILLTIIPALVYSLRKYTPEFKLVVVKIAE